MAATTSSVLVSSDRRIARVLRVFAGDLSKRPSLAKAASTAGLQPAYFSRLFRQVTGTTFSDWNARMRVDEAKQLLRLVDLSITAVAASVGYSDVTTFARVFRRCEGICPRRYRRMLVQNKQTTIHYERKTRIAESKTTDAETGFSDNQ
jgi:AraC-like DNA-binding protein